MLFNHFYEVNIRYVILNYLLVFTERIFRFFSFFANPLHLSQQNYQFSPQRNVTAPNPTMHPLNVAATFRVEKSLTL